MLFRARKRGQKASDRVILHQRVYDGGLAPLIPLLNCFSRPATPHQHFIPILFCHLSTYRRITISDYQQKVDPGNLCLLFSEPGILCFLFSEPAGNLCFLFSEPGKQNSPCHLQSIERKWQNKRKWRRPSLKPAIR